MKLSTWMSRVQRYANTVNKKPGFRQGSHVLMMSPPEYDELMDKAIKAYKPKDKVEFMHLHGLLIAKVPTIAKRKWQVIPTQDYVKWVEKYKKAGRFTVKKAATRKPVGLNEEAA